MRWYEMWFHRFEGNAEHSQSMPHEDRGWHHQPEGPAWGPLELLRSDQWPARCKRNWDKQTETKWNTMKHNETGPSALNNFADLCRLPLLPFRAQEPWSPPLQVVPPWPGITIHATHEPDGPRAIHRNSNLKKARAAVVWFAKRRSYFEPSPSGVLEVAEMLSGLSGKKKTKNCTTTIIYFWAPFVLKFVPIYIWFVEFKKLYVFMFSDIYWSVYKYIHMLISWIYVDCLVYFHLHIFWTIDINTTWEGVERKPAQLFCAGCCNLGGSPVERVARCATLHCENLNDPIILRMAITRIPKIAAGLKKDVEIIIFFQSI